MRKGFTLVEVLAVIVILGLLVVIISPVVNNLLGDSEDALYQEQVDVIVKASKKYAVEHSELLPEGNDSTAIYINDLINNGVIDKDKVIDPKTKEEMNGCVVISYNNDFNQYEYNYRDNCTITITFDPEGGSVDVASKEVRIGKTYGELPIPTREGYTFKGWRGKNMFNIDAAVNSCLIDNYDGTYTMWYNNICRISNEVEVLIQENKTIIFSYNLIEYNGTYQYPLQFHARDIDMGNVYFSYPDITNTTPKNLVKDIIKLKIYQDGSQSLGIYTKFNNLQLEEGDTVTDYEPYQEFDSDTVVKKGSNYTLHAIWEVAS